MSMEVNRNYTDYKNDYPERLREGKEKTKESIPVPKDEYLGSEQSGTKPSGLYHMGKDENGNPKVIYDDPNKAVGADRRPKVKSGSREEDGEEVTVNTDAVDREIEKLKKQKQQLEQQIRRASGDEEKRRELERKLSQIEGELSQKDNDTYRRQRAKTGKA